MDTSDRVRLGSHRKLDNVYFHSSICNVNSIHVCMSGRQIFVQKYTKKRAWRAGQKIGKGTRRVHNAVNSSKQTEVSAREKVGDGLTKAFLSPLLDGGADQ